MNSDFPSDRTSQRRSTFVSVLAWLFIILSGFGTFISIFQNIAIHMTFRKEQTSQAMKQMESIQHLPSFASFIFKQADLIFLLFLIISATCFVSSIALLKRRNWARIIFIILMCFGIASNLGGVVLQFTMFGKIPEMAGRSAPPEFESMLLITKVASVLMAVGMSALFAWIIKKLTSSPIRAEFS